MSGPLQLPIQSIPPDSSDLQWKRLGERLPETPTSSLCTCLPMVPAGECQVFDVPVIYIQDVVTWIYQHSKHAAEESSTLSPIAKYWISLARFVQNPLSEHAALGTHITAISFRDEDQHLILKEKLLIALERVLVDMTNKVGMEIKRMVTDSYYQHLLSLVCSLGPHKANTLVRKIATLDSDLKSAKNPHVDEDGPDPLDAAHVHPEDYKLAQKTVTDALKLDEENIHGEHPSHMQMKIADSTPNVVHEGIHFFLIIGAQNLPNMGLGGGENSAACTHVRQVPGCTPNAHSSQTPAPPPAYGGGIPSSRYGMPSQLPFHTLSPHMHIHTHCFQWDNPPLHIPLGMNPQHAAMIQNSGDQGGCFCTVKLQE
ncbi:hypothetical protein BKA83DRAFT_4122503 [Pisolithus microcarpus]|nr:hypothetical protein BKA83DRAFT_4122503 [Pisolithus microcarpus]